MYKEIDKHDGTTNTMLLPRSTKYTTKAHFKRAQKTAGILSILALAAFLFFTYLAVPAFFAHWYLIIPLALLLVYTRSFGSWEAYTTVRHQSEVIAEALEELDIQNNNKQAKELAENV
jgi:hypothetical protein